jgi:NADH dehydrogenase FAD-containing subunit
MSRCFPPRLGAKLASVDPNISESKPAARWLDAEHDRAGRVNVGVDLSVPSHPDIFVLSGRSRWAAMSAGSSPRASQAGLRHRHLAIATWAISPPSAAKPRL